MPPIQVNAMVVKIAENALTSAQNGQKLSAKHESAL